MDTINNDLYVNGTLTPKGLNPPAQCIGPLAIVSPAQPGQGLPAAGVIHRHEKNYSQEGATNAATETRVLHVVYGSTGTIIGFHAGAVVVLTGNDTCTLDLKKNGTTILTAVVSLASSDTVYVVKPAAGFTSTALVAGDVLTVTVTATHNAGALPKGVFCRVTLDEDAQ
jgi:hypothetical protein